MGLYVCLVLSFVLVILTGIIPEWGCWYSIEDRYRMQTSALAEGHFSLGNTLSGLQHDNTWSGGGVHQVWGLGIPFLRLPFEMLARVFGSIHSRISWFWLSGSSALPSGAAGSWCRRAAYT
jgi:hypothetical protein